MSQEFLGVGWKFPVQTDDQGEIALSRHEEDIRERIWIILGTAPGERLMRPEFGCGIHDYVFSPNNSRTAGLVRFHVEEALTRWEPRIDLEEVNVQADPGRPVLLRINIRYRVRATDTRFNLVYPFYLERVEVR
ncbi:MAG: GPW/gp25 family protein [Deltaproteobacteria bacterium]|nr:GPW/gp25 family protein [Deltaproteobacteria bacterium]